MRKAIDKKKWLAYALKLADNLVDQYNICGDDVLVSLLVTGKGVYFVRAKRARHYGDDDEDDEPDDEIPEPLNWNKRKAERFRPSYFG